MSNDASGRRSVSRRLAGLATVVAIALGLTPAAVASPAPGSDQPLWAMAQSGDLYRGFERSDFNEEDGSPRPLRAPDGRMGLQFQLEPGDDRSELEPEVPNQTEGTVQWYTYSATLHNGFPADTDRFQVILQWHHKGDSGSPPIAVEVREDRLQLTAEGEHYEDLGPVGGGDRIDLTMRILFSQDTGKGTVDVWRDGRHVLQDYRPPGGTLIDEHNFLKVGYYRSEEIDDFGRLWLHDLRVGRTLDSVRTEDDGPSARIPRQEDPAGRAPGSSDTSSTLPWIGGGLLVVLALVGAGVVAGRRGRRDRTPRP